MQPGVPGMPGMPGMQPIAYPMIQQPGVPMQFIPPQGTHFPPQPFSPMPPGNKVPEAQIDEQPELQAKPGIFTDQRGNLKVRGPPPAAIDGMSRRRAMRRCCWGALSLWLHELAIIANSFPALPPSSRISAPDLLPCEQFVAMLSKCPCISLVAVYTIAIALSAILWYVSVQA